MQAAAINVQLIVLPIYQDVQTGGYIENLSDQQFKNNNLIEEQDWEAEMSKTKLS